MYTKPIHVLECIQKCLQEGQISVLNGIMCFAKCNVGVDSGVNCGVTVYYSVLWMYTLVQMSLKTYPHLQQMYTGETSNPNNN
jgi:hypothetical protein